MEASSAPKFKKGKQKHQHDPAHVPIDKLLTNLRKAYENNDSRQRVVLFQSGSYNPAHRMHTEMFEVARRFVESKDFPIPSIVVGGYAFISARAASTRFCETSQKVFCLHTLILELWANCSFMSPSGDSYVSHKMQVASGGPQRHFTKEDRLEILRRATADSDCLEVTALECYDSASKSFNGVRSNILLQKQLGWLSSQCYPS
jgi:hypothetical protein